MFEFSKAENALIFGINKGIGLAIAENLLTNYPNLVLYGVYRTDSNELDELKIQFQERFHLFKVRKIDEENLGLISNKLKSQNIKLQFIFSAIGVLHNETLQPEKSLRSLEHKSFMQVIETNTLSFGLIVKTFEKFLSKDVPSMISCISAKVGSISDNRMGGWYSYRISKAALNMLIKCLAIELGRKYKHLSVISIHPGTTRSSLSEPFIKNTPYKLHTPAETAQNILNVLNGKNEDQTGSFYSWDGEELPW